MISIGSEMEANDCATSNDRSWAKSVARVMASSLSLRCASSCGERPSMAP